MKDLITEIVQALFDQPGEVSVNEICKIKSRFLQKKINSDSLRDDVTIFFIGCNNHFAISIQ